MVDIYWWVPQLRKHLDHLDEKDRQKLEVFRNGAELVSVETEPRADEIAAAIHDEMHWMAAATEMVWQTYPTEEFYSAPCSNRTARSRVAAFAAITERSCRASLNS